MRIGEKTRFARIWPSASKIGISLRFACPLRSERTYKKTIAFKAKVALKDEAIKRHINQNCLVRLALGRPWACLRDKPSLSLGKTKAFSLFYTADAQFVPGANPGFHKTRTHPEPQSRAWATEAECQTSARTTNSNSCSTGPGLREFFKQVPYYREKGPGVQGERWPKYRYCFSCLKLRGGSLPSKVCPCDKPGANGRKHLCVHVSF